jgi:hypothetical protein
MRTHTTRKNRMSSENGPAAAPTDFPRLSLPPPTLTNLRKKILFTVVAWNRPRTLSAARCERFTELRREEKLRRYQKLLFCRSYTNFEKLSVDAFTP